MDIVKVPAILRTGLGKAETKKFRKTGVIPVVIYGGKDNVHCGVKKNDIKSLVYTPDFKLAEVELNGAKHKCLIKDIQFHPVTDEILHVDFLQLIDKQPLKAQVPVVCVGTSLGQKEGGKLQQNLRRIKIKTTPENLVNQLTVNIESLELGDAVRVRDIDAIEGVEVMNPGATPVASVEVPRALKSATAAEEEAEEGAAETAEGGEPAADAPAEEN